MDLCLQRVLQKFLLPTTLESFVCGPLLLQRIMKMLDEIFLKMYLKPSASYSANENPRRKGGTEKLAQSLMLLFSSRFWLIPKWQLRD